MRVVRAVAGAVVAVGGFAAVPASPAGACGPDPFTPELRRQVAAMPGRLTASVLEVGTGCRWDLRPGLTLTTASVVKVQIGATVLLRAQQRGRGLTRTEQARLWPMITRSENPPTSALWGTIGGRPTMARSASTFGMRSTTPVAPAWGLTRTTARDQVELLRRVVVGQGSPLDAAHRRPLVDAMRSVVPGQRWGVSAGAPAGSDVALKNGFYPANRLGWRIGSVGVVRHPDGRQLVVAILSDGWGRMQQGIDAVERVGWAVNRDGDLSGFSPARGSWPPGLPASRRR